MLLLDMFQSCEEGAEEVGCEVGWFEGLRGGRGEAGEG